MPANLETNRYWKIGFLFKSNSQNKKEQYNEQKIKKLEDDVQNTPEFKNLTEFVGEFEKPSLTIKTSIYTEYRCFAYNDLTQSFIFGYGTGEVKASMIF